MSLPAGTRLGPYEIIGPLGAGGMGEVYRGRDAKLSRDVALKILPESVSNDPERQARFRREATVLASLNHPNIGHIYGFEDSGATHALVLELVEGPTLADRLAQGPLDPSEALTIARQVADAIETAHEAGIIHRDLKPANIKVRTDGTVKVLDFGLAKALDQAQGSGLGPQGDVSNSPTMTSPAHTAMGIILGTAAYMAPEQARGRPIDRRADIWAFGCVLFEMLTGKATFAGDNVTDTLAAVVRGEPDWAALPADTPASIRRLLRRSLAKDRKERLADIGVARLEIDDASKPAAREEATATLRRDVRAPRLWFAAAFFAGAVVAAASAWMLRPAPAAAPLTMRFALAWPEGQAWFGNAGVGVAISPDGRYVAYFARGGPSPLPQLHVRRLTDDQTRVIRSDGGYAPFFSPDSQQVGFVASQKLWRAPVADGAAFEIGSVDPADRGVTWSADGFIYSAGTAGVSRIPVAGGARESLTTVNQAAGEIAHRFPVVVPGGNAVLFTIFKGALEDARIAAVNIQTKEIRVVMDLPGHSAQVTPTGHLVYLRSGVLMAVRFDASRLQVVGVPQPLMSGIAFNNGGAAHFAISATGSMVFVPNTESVSRKSLAWADRAGKMTPIDIPPDAYIGGSLSPDGSRVALVRVNPRGSADTVVWNFASRALTPVTRDLAHYESPIWAPDGRSIVFTHRAQIGSFGRMMRVPSDGSAAPAPVLTTPAEQLFGDSAEVPGSFSSDGKTLFYSQRATKSDGVWTLELETGKTERVLAQRAGWVRASPDGRWLAINTAESGPPQVAVRPYPDASGGERNVGPQGAVLPRWSADGRELFYATREGIFSVAVGAGPAPTIGTPQLLVPSSGQLSATARPDWYDVAPDGKQFLVLQRDPATPNVQDVPNVIVNWFEELKAIR